MLCCVAAMAVMGAALRLVGVLRGGGRRASADGGFPPPARREVGAPAHAEVGP